MIKRGAAREIGVRTHIDIFSLLKSHFLLPSSGTKREEKKMKFEKEGRKRYRRRGGERRQGLRRIREGRGRKREGKGG